MPSMQQMRVEIRDLANFPIISIISRFNGPPVKGHATQHFVPASDASRSNCVRYHIVLQFALK